VDKIDLCVGYLINLRDSIEDLLDELVPPPAEEALEHQLSEAPPERGVALPTVKGGRRGSVSTIVPKK